MDGVLMGLLVGLVFAFIVYKLKKSKDETSEEDVRGGSGNSENDSEKFEQTKNTK